ncbi:MAG: M23 family metallopeptidase [Actinobacteria bacterium]|nr:M23 family metallopeptidase [Actinomycetota bacterium]
MFRAIGGGFRALPTLGVVASLGVAASFIAPTATATAPVACTAAGMLAILGPQAVAPRALGPSLASASRSSIPVDGYSAAPELSGLAVDHVDIGVAGCRDAKGTPGGTSLRATKWSVLDGAVAGGALRADLVPAEGDGTGWRLRMSITDLRIEGQDATAPENTAIDVGDWGTLGPVQPIDAGPGQDLRWWDAALELRLTRAHAGFAANTRFLIGWVSADRRGAAAAPSPAAVAPGQAKLSRPAQREAGPKQATKKSSQGSQVRGQSLLRARRAALLARRARAAQLRAEKRERAAHLLAVRVRKAQVARARRAAQRRRRQEQLVLPTGLPLHTHPRLGGIAYDFPVAGEPAWGNTYGAGRSDVPGGWHHGDDLFATLGTPVLAVADGVVFAVGWNDVGGWRLWLRDRLGHEFYYAHLAGYTGLARNDRHVRRGQVLGFVGNTGDAFTTLPHLHFEIHPFGLLSLGYDGAVDPSGYLADWKHIAKIEEVPPPVPLPSGAPLGSGSQADFRQLLALRPLPLKVSAPPKQPHREPPGQALAVAGGHVAARTDDGWGPTIAGLLVLTLALLALGRAARDGRSD